MRRHLVALSLLTFAGLFPAGALAQPPFSPQPFGTFRWQLQPFCNVVTLDVVQQGSAFTLNGFDDQCGAATRAAVAGTAFVNPNGSIGLGLALTATPGAAPLHVDIALDFATLGGTWRDSAGHQGGLAFNPPTPAAGPARPVIGSNNTAIGPSVLSSLTTGASNVAVGRDAGDNLTTGSSNIYLGAVASSPAESTTMRLGTPGTHGNTYIAGIFASSVNGASDVPVLVDATGKLGSLTSSERFKEDVHVLGEDGLGVLRLEPVSFRYRADQQRGDARQYGLMAEQVATVLPDLVVRDEQGQPLTVKYHLLPTLLLAEIQRLERERAVQADAIAELREEIKALRAQRR